MLTFLSTLSLRRATQCRTLASGMYGFLSTLSLRRATIGAITYVVMTPDFYPRSPCGERPGPRLKTSTVPKFLSTLSLRRATTSRLYKILADWDFYPRSPCGERLWANSSRAPPTVISIHALLAESDHSRGLLPKWGHRISIHALLAESDLGKFLTSSSHGHFYPRSPCGERPYGHAFHVPFFQISIHALLAESDLIALFDFPIVPAISIHALLAESDNFRRAVKCAIADFYPRSPCGERLSTSERLFIPSHYFYPRSPCGERQYLARGQRPN